MLLCLIFDVLPHVKGRVVLVKNWIALNRGDNSFIRLQSWHLKLVEPLVKLKLARQLQSFRMFSKQLLDKLDRILSFTLQLKKWINRAVDVCPSRVDLPESGNRRVIDKVMSVPTDDCLCFGLFCSPSCFFVHLLLSICLFQSLDQLFCR
jgi:hypothetical protein